MPTIDVSQFRTPEEYFDHCERHGLTPTPIPYTIWEQIMDRDYPIVYSVVHNPCGNYCHGNHPHAVIRQVGRWYLCQGQDVRAGIHVCGLEWTYVTKDYTKALELCQYHMAG